jgi:molybdenum cofactor cytidylyltransferase
MTMNDNRMTMNDNRMTMNDICAIVLAAGKSERMGSQKLLLPYGNLTIIETVIDNILQAGIEHILVVLGADGPEILKAIEGKPVQTCFNDRYAEGMHTSVVCGFRNLPENARAATLFLGDQPFIPSEAIRRVILSWKESGNGIIIPTCHGRRGHPTLFDLKMKEQILQLDPATGLRSVFTAFPEEILEAEINFPAILRDIDTKIDYLNELNQMNDNGRKNHF